MFDWAITPYKQYPFSCSFFLWLLSKINFTHALLAHSLVSLLQTRLRLSFYHSLLHMADLLSGFSLRNFVIQEQLPPLSFFCYRGYASIFKNQPSLMWYVLLAYYWFLLMALETCWPLGCSQSVFLPKYIRKWRESILVYSSIPCFGVRRSLNTRLSDRKRKDRPSQPISRDDNWRNANVFIC